VSVEKVFGNVLKFKIVGDATSNELRHTHRLGVEYFRLEINVKVTREASEVRVDWEQ
jgi:hypothetical protein